MRNNWAKVAPKRLGTGEIVQHKYFDAVNCACLNSSNMSRMNDTARTPEDIDPELPNYGINSVDPEVFRLSRSLCACTAALSAYFAPILIDMFSFLTILNLF